MDLVKSHEPDGTEIAISHFPLDLRNLVLEWKSSVGELGIVTLNCGLKTLKKHPKIVAGVISNGHSGFHGSLLAQPKQHGNEH